MRRAGRAKYSREEIEQAMAKVQTGRSLSEVARELGMSKAGLSYRLSRLSEGGPVSGPLDSRRWQGAFALICWKNLSRVNRQLAQKMDAASFSELVRLFESLSDVLLKLGPTVSLQIQAKVQPELASTSETRLLVEQYLRKQGAKSDLGGPPLEQEKTTASKVGWIRKSI